MALAIAVLGWTLAYWTWSWFSPLPEVRLQTLSAPSGHIDAAGSLFGQIQHSVASAGGTIKLLGIIAASSGGGSGYALLSFAGQPVRSVKEGRDIAPGVTLSAVRAGEIVVERSGISETVALPEKKNASPVTGALK